MAKFFLRGQKKTQIKCLFIPKKTFLLYCSSHTTQIRELSFFHFICCKSNDLYPKRLYLTSDAATRKNQHEKCLIRDPMLMKSLSSSDVSDACPPLQLKLFWLWLIFPWFLPCSSLLVIVD